MAFNVKNSEMMRVNDLPKIDLRKVGAQVKNVRVVTNSLVAFTLACDGFSFYNMQFVEGKDGRRFIAPPTTKGRDGKYYKQYAVYLNDVDELALMDELCKIIEAD